MIKINIAEFDVKCSDIAKVLGGLYMPQPDCWVPRGQIILPGSVITVAGNSHNGTVEVSGVWPTNQKNEMFFPRGYDKSPYSAITCSLSRNAKAIANDITRRFLPAYLMELGVQKVRCAGSDNYLNSTANNAANLAKLADTSRADHAPNRISLHSDRSDVWGHAEVSGDNVNFELRGLSPAQAEAVINIFKTL